MFRLDFIKDIGRCLYLKCCVTLCLVGIIGFTIYSCSKINAAKTDYIDKMFPPQFSVVPVIKPQSDSLKIYYEALTKRQDQMESIVRNYQSDADVYIGKATDMFSMWLGISAAFIAIVIGLSVWNNYKQEKSAEKIKRELECTAQINKISSIMTCLNSLPDPLLTDLESDRRLYVKNYIELLHKEFCTYIKLINSNQNFIDNEMKYVQLVLTVMKIAILRAQNVFSDKVSNVVFYTFSFSLEKCIKGIQSGGITQKDLRRELKDIQSQFDKLNTAL